MTGRSSTRRGIALFPRRRRRRSAVAARTTSRPAIRQRRLEQLAERFAEFGAAGTRFLEGLLAGSRYGKNQAERVLSLAAAYPRHDVLAALERAVRYGAFSLAAVQRILAARSRPKTPLDALADDHRTYLDRLLERDPTPPRPTSDYQALLGEEPHDGEPTVPDVRRHPRTDPSERPRRRSHAACMTTSPRRCGRWASR